MVKKLVFEDTQIVEKHCNTFKTRIVLKDFQNYMVCDGLAFYAKAEKDADDMTRSKEPKTHLTADEVLRWYNEAELAEYREGVLTIHTEKYIFHVEVNKK